MAETRPREGYNVATLNGHTENHDNGGRKPWMPTTARTTEGLALTRSKEGSKEDTNTREPMELALEATGSKKEQPRGQGVRQSKEIPKETERNRQKWWEATATATASKRDAKAPPNRKRQEEIRRQETESKERGKGDPEQRAETITIWTVTKAQTPVKPATVQHSLEEASQQLRKNTAYP